MTSLGTIDYPALSHRSTNAPPVPHRPELGHAVSLGIYAFGLSCHPTCGAGCRQVTVRDRSSPGLMARRPAVRSALMAAPWQDGPPQLLPRRVGESPTSLRRC